VKVANNFNDQENLEIEDIEVSITLEDVDDGDGFRLEQKHIGILALAAPAVSVPV
jgi:hypothetical protein